MQAGLCEEMCVLLRDGVYHSISWHIILQADGCVVFWCVRADNSNVVLLR